MTFRHPFQKLCGVPSQQEDRQLLLAASGPTISCICFHERKLLSQWPTRHDDDDDDMQDVDRGDNGDPPNKRRKIDPDERAPVSRQDSEASEVSIEIVSERRKGERKKSKFIDTKLPNISHLLVTSDGSHAIVVTAEDKTLRVLEIGSSGTLKQVSQRVLPKKLCAVRLTIDEQVILAADKFGDVYSLPLHPSKDWVPKEKPKNDEKFKPSASELTIHTRQNREALRHQMEQKTEPRKEGPNYEHQVVLGHVSLLTDLLVAEADVGGKNRPFIITADRDEHIRVSRGIPQAHVIENFCLGNTEFVTRLCIPPAAPHILISGSGEPSLSTHLWRSGETLDQGHKGAIEIRLGVALEDILGQPIGLEHLPEGRSMKRLAVSGIWPIEFSRCVNPKGVEQSLVLVAVEGMPCLFPYVLSEDRLSACDSLDLPGNVLDVAPAPNGKPQLLVSIDNVHRTCSMKDYRDSDRTQTASLHLLELTIRKNYVGTHGKFEWIEVELPFDIADIDKALPAAPPPLLENNSKSKGYERTLSPLGDILYGLENLRKKRDAPTEEGAEEGATAETGEAEDEEEADLEVS